MTSNAECPMPELKQYIVKYQDPQQADSIMKIQKELDETKIVLHKTIESVLERGEKLDNLVEKSNGLSAQSKMFYTQVGGLSPDNGLCSRSSLTRDLISRPRSKTPAVSSCKIILCRTFPFRGARFLFGLVGITITVNEFRENIPSLKSFIGLAAAGRAN